MSTTGRRTVPRERYREYIQSPAWGAVKLRYRTSRLPQECLVCGEPYVHLHHRTYKNLGNERLMDLVPLCPEHHQAVHDHHKHSGRDLWRATKDIVRGRR